MNKPINVELTDERKDLSKRERRQGKLRIVLLVTTSDNYYRLSTTPRATATMTRKTQYALMTLPIPSLRHNSKLHRRLRRSHVAKTATSTRSDVSHRLHLPHYGTRC